MSPLEYLNQNIVKMYRPYPDVIVVKATKDYNPPFKLPNGQIHCTGSFYHGGKQFLFIKNNECDGCIYYGLPNSIFYKTYNPKINSIGNWLNNSLFAPMIQNAEMQSTKTELVKLRIGINIILETNISVSSKLAWTEWIKELYWNRKAVLHKWYMEEVLPFQLKEYLLRVVGIGFPTTHY